VGALTGSTAQALADTAGSVVILSVGGNNASGGYAGILSGVGSLTKTGSGTLTFSNANTCAGDTVINAGTVKLSNGGSLASGNIWVAAGPRWM
jgi:autotransporter-associated beta strand protein